MSAIGFSRTKSGFNDRAFLVGAHADFRLENYVFPRTQSRSLTSLEWESRIKPMHSWGEFGIYGLGTTLGALAVFVLL